MADVVIGVWSVVVGVIALNGFAAGIVAGLHVRRRSMRRRSRVLLAAVAAGLLPAQFMIVVPLAEGGAGEELFIWALAFGMSLAVGTLLSLPGAIVASRKLDAPGDDYRAFE